MIEAIDVEADREVLTFVHPSSQVNLSKLILITRRNSIEIEIEIENGIVIHIVRGTVQEIVESTILTGQVTGPPPVIEYDQENGTL